MAWVKAVPSEQTKTGGRRPRHCGEASNKYTTMKTLTKIILALVLFATALAARAEWVNGYTRTDGTYVSGHYRNTSGSSYSTMPTYRSTPSYPGSSSGYVYRNPYAATPSVEVRGYNRSNGTYVAPHVRTPANRTVTDNLSYRGYGTTRVRRW